jgi:N-methylhydantoinase A
VLQADLMHDDVTPLHSSLASLDPQTWRIRLDVMRERGDDLLAEEGVAQARRRFDAAADVRYVGQHDDISVPLMPDEWSGENLGPLLQRFHHKHDELNGYCSPEQPCEVTALHLTSVGLLERRGGQQFGQPTPRAVAPALRRIWLEGGPAEVPVRLLTHIHPGQVIAGPAVVEAPGSTLILLPGFEAGVDRHGNLLAYLASRRDFANRLKVAQ